LKILSEMSTVTTNLQTSTISTCHAWIGWFEIELYDY
jgi:hypothetical protein